MSERTSDRRLVRTDGIQHRRGVRFDAWPCRPGLWGRWTPLRARCALWTERRTVCCHGALLRLSQEYHHPRRCGERQVILPLNHRTQWAGSAPSSLDTLSTLINNNTDRHRRIPQYAPSAHMSHRPRVHCPYQRECSSPCDTHYTSNDQKHIHAYEESTTYTEPLGPPTTCRLYVLE